MTEKDKASPRQRQIMEQRWADAREKCAAKTCPPASRYHVAGCERRNNRMVTLAPEQKVKVTNLNTGRTSEATIVHSDFRAVKEVLDQHEKQAVRLEPEPDDFPQEYWDEFEKGHPAARYSYGGVAEQMPAEEQEQLARDVFMNAVPEGWGDAAVTAPARPWWKFWGRRVR